MNPFMFYTLLLTTGIPFFGFSQTLSLIPKKDYTTERISETEIPTIDGILNDSIWVNQRNWESNFIQREPNENSLPSVVKILFDINQPPPIFIQLIFKSSVALSLVLVAFDNRKLN
jgi:hypothetical protein